MVDVVSGSGWRGPTSFTLTDGGIVKSWGLGASDLFGFSAPDVVGKPFSTLYTEEARSAGIPDAVLRRAREAGRASLAGWKVSAAGKPLFLVGAVDACLGASGELDAFVVTFSSYLDFDRPDLARGTGHALGRPDPELFIEALEGMHDIFFVLDPVFRFVYVNAKAEQAWGLSRAVVVGRPVWEVFPHLIDSEVLAEQVRAMLAGMPSRFTALSPVIGKQVQVNAYPRRNGGLAMVVRECPDDEQEAGRPAAGKSAAGKVTKGAAKGAKATPTLPNLSEAYDSLGVAVYSWRPDTGEWSISGHVHDVFGLKADGAISGTTSLRSLMLPDDARLHDLVVAAGVRQRTGWHTEYRVLRPRDNKVAWLEEHVRFEDAGDGQRYVGMVWDVSVVKAAEERLGATRSLLREELVSNRRLQEYLARAKDAGDPQLALGHLVEAAVDLLGAARGTIRLLDREAGTVTIRAQCGFDADYLVTHGVTAVDIEEYERQALGNRDEGAGRRGRQGRGERDSGAVNERWVPLFELGGQLIGVMALHWDQPHALKEREGFDLDTLAHQAGTIAEVLQATERASALGESVKRTADVSVDELAQAEIRSRRVFEVGLMAAVITTQDEDRFLDVNGGYTRLTGYQANEVVGRTAAELGMWSSREDQEKLRLAFERSDEFKELDLKLRRKDGSVRNILLSGSKIVFQGKPAWLKMFNDVTEHQQSREELMTAIRTVMADADWFSQSVVERLSQIRGGGSGRSEDDADLSQRERQVIERVAMGMSDEKISADLGISVKTVRNHLSNAYAKMDVHNRAEAVVWARDRGIGLA